MIKVVRADKKQIVIRREEVLRYLGYGAHRIDASSADVVEACIAEVFDGLSCKACYDRFPLSHHADGAIQFASCRTASESLKKNLNGCEQIILFTATIGLKIDRIIQKYERLSLVKAVAAQAAGAAAIEAWCDLLCEKFAQEERKNGNFLHPRFSPGYGDFPLETQKTIISVLDCSRKIGVSLTEGMMMLPSKSVSAVVGISANPYCAEGGCGTCEHTECEMRRG